MRTTIALVVAGVVVGVLAMAGAATAAPSGDGSTSGTKTVHRHASKHHKATPKTSAPHKRHARKHPVKD